jgi:hypothetical protein
MRSPSRHVALVVAIGAVSWGGCGGGSGGVAPGDEGVGPDPAPLDVPVLDVTYPDLPSPDLDDAGVDADAAEDTAQDLPDEDAVAIPDEAPDDGVAIEAVDLPLDENPAPDLAEETDAPPDLVPDESGDAPHLCAPNSADCKCATNADCDPAYTTVCGVNACNKANEMCVLAPAKPDGTSCDDGDACTEGDACSKTKCVGAPVSCDDENPCTLDTCDPASGCGHAAIAGVCEAGDPCRGPDTCVEGACVEGPAVACDDKNDCTSDACEGTKGCVYTPVSGGCDDNDVCTTGDHCQSGLCAPTGALDCNDNDPCTADSCNRLSGCEHASAADGTACDDGDPCTAADQCTGGACAGTDTGVCFSCPDGTCNEPSETCKSCPEDCGDCPPDCVLADGIGCGGSRDGTTAGGTNAMESYAFPECFWLSATSGPEAVVPFATKAAVRVNAKVTASGGSPYLFVLEQNCQASSCIAEGIGFLSSNATASFLPASGQTYYLTVDGSGSGFPFHLAATCVEAACADGVDNDGNGLTDCDDAECGGVPLACNGGSKDGTVSSYSHVQGYGSSCANASGTWDDAVYSLTVDTPKTITITVTSDPTTSGDDFDVFVLSGGCTGGACVAAGRGGGSTETITFPAQPGTYRIVVELYSSGSDGYGDFTISASCL